MNNAWIQSTRASMIKPPAPRRPALATAVKMYRTDMLFRGLVDVAAAGVLVLAFSLNWGASLSSALGFIGKQRSQLNGVLSEVQQSSQTNSEIGQKIAQGLTTIRIDRSSIETSGDPAKDKLLAVADALNDRQLPMAELHLNGLDDRNPLIAYVKAAVLLSGAGKGRIAEAQALLRQATAQGVFPAYILAGQMAYMMIVADEKDTLPASERILVDDTGTAHTATREQLAAAADSWWQRAGAFGRPEGLRLAAFAKARGLSGKPDLVAAAAMWSIAAVAGDALSQYELGMLLMNGAGVQSDLAGAIALFRRAQPEIPEAALAIATAQMPAAMAGDREASEEGITMAGEAIDRLAGRNLEGMAHWVLGLYLYQAAVPDMRDLSRGVDEFEKATKLGYDIAASSAGAAYRAGIGKQKDPVCAYAFYLRLRKTGDAEVLKILGELAAEIGPSGIKLAEDINFALVPATKGWGNFPEIKSTIKVDAPPVPKTWRSACQ